jgi:hypothetical protein
MADFLFSAEGEARGFRVGNLIYAMDGTAVGQIFAERAYRLDGTFVGSLHRNMVVEKPDDEAADRPAIRKPNAFASPPKCQFKSKALGATFLDVFDRLLASQVVSQARPRVVTQPTARRVWEEEDDFFGFTPARGTGG